MNRVDSNFFAVANNFNFVSGEKPKATTFIDFIFSDFDVENDYDLVDEILGLDDFDDEELFDDYGEFYNFDISNDFNKFDNFEVKNENNGYFKNKSEAYNYYAKCLAQIEYEKCIGGVYSHNNKDKADEIMERYESDPKFQEAKKICEGILQRDKNDPDRKRLERIMRIEWNKMQEDLSKLGHTW